MNRPRIRRMNRPRNRRRRRIPAPVVSPADIELVRRLGEEQERYFKLFDSPADQRKPIEAQFELIIGHVELVMARVGSNDVLVPIRRVQCALVGVDSNRNDPILGQPSGRRSKLPIAEILFRALAAATMRWLMRSRLNRVEAANEAARLLKSGPYAEKDARGYQIQDWRNSFRQQEFGTGTAVYVELADPAALQPGQMPRQKALEYARQPPVLRIRRR